MGMSINLQKTANKKAEVVTKVFNAIFLLFLLHPQMLIAETNTRNDHVQAQEILANAPKNPEEFFVRLKTLLQNQNNDGLNFAEKLTGIGMDKWKTDPCNKNDFYRPYSFNLWRDGLWKDIDADKWPPFSSRPTISFWPSLTVDDYRDNVFFNFRMKFKVSRKVDNFHCITPEATQESLGKTLKILSYIDDKTENSHSSQIIYKYKINNFKVRIQYEINDDTPSTIKYDSNLLENYKNHKSLCASEITVSRANPLKLQHSGAHSEWIQEISAKIPKNANEFLRRLKSSWENQKSNVFDVAEEITEVSLNKWMKIQNEGLLRYHLYIPPDDSEDYPVFPYVFLVKSKTNNSSFHTYLRSFKHVKSANNKYSTHHIVCITPAETKEILGEPSAVKGDDHRTMEGSFSNTKYLYEIDNTTIEFIFPNPGGASKKYIDFDQHKQFCASSIEFIKK